MPDIQRASLDRILAAQKAYTGSWRAGDGAESEVPLASETTPKEGENMAIRLRGGFDVDNNSVAEVGMVAGEKEEKGIMNWADEISGPNLKGAVGEGIMPSEPGDEDSLF